MVASINSLWYSIGRFMEATFDLLIVPLGKPFNLIVFLVCVFGVFFWLRLQLKYNKAAKDNNTIK